MTRLCVVVAFLLLMAGCSAEDQRQWNEAMKDWRGDNQVMRSAPQSAFHSPDD
jgi:uncharacterized protein YcfL